MKTADFKAADWLDWFTGLEDGHDSLRVPFHFDGWRIATDGVIMVAAPAPGTIQTENIPLALTRGIMPMLTQPRDYRTIPAKDMKEWSGPCEHPTSLTLCPECDAGMVAHRCDCPFCEQEEEECPECHGEFNNMDRPAERVGTDPWCGTQLDKNLLAYVFEHTPFVETLNIWSVRTTLCLQSETSWIAAIAGCVTGD